MKYSVYVAWGEKHTISELAKEDPEDYVCCYEFDTEAERNAFCYALNEHEGWTDCYVSIDKKEVDDFVKELVYDPLHDEDDGEEVEE